MLDALEDAADHIGCPDDDDAIGVARRTIRARLAHPEPEPVAWLHSFTGYGWQVVPEKLYPTDQPLYTAPPQREWQGLTTAETKALWNATKKPSEFAALLQAKLKEKNG